MQAQPWAQLSFYEADVNAMWSCWKTMFLEVLDSHAPIRSKRVRWRPRLPWLSKDIRDKMLERDRLKVPVTLIFCYFRRKVEAFTNQNILKRLDFLQSFMFF